MKRLHRIGSAGFSLSELLVSISIIGAMSTIALPTAWTYLPAAAASGGAREIRAILSQARMVAITTRQNICVQTVAGGFRFLQSGELTSQQLRVHEMAVPLPKLVGYVFVATAQINELHLFAHAQVTSIRFL